MAGPSEPQPDPTAASCPADAAGIQLPAATAVDGFTADEVTAGRLDDTLLVKHDPSPAPVNRRLLSGTC